MKVTSYTLIVVPMLLLGCRTASHPLQGNWLEKFSEWEKVSPKREYSIQVDQNEMDAGSPSLRFELRDGEGWKNKSGELSYRAEVVVGDYSPLNSILTYSCNVKFPVDFPIEENRLILMQWWPKTKKELGEVGRSPSLALRFVEGRLYATVRTSNIK